MHRPLSLFLLAAALLPALHADDASKTAKITEIFRLTKVDQLQKQMLDQIKPLIPPMAAQAGLPNSDALNAELNGRILDVLAARLSWDKMKPLFTRLYADAFTEEEIDGILNFYRSPSGQAMLTKMPSLASKTLNLAQEQMQGAYPEVQKVIAQFAAEHANPKPAPRSSAPPQ